MSTEIRLAEDQMQELKRSIWGTVVFAVHCIRSNVFDLDHVTKVTWLGADKILAAEPKPEPASVCVPHSLSQPHKPSVYGPGDHGYFGEPKSGPKQTECPTYDPEGYRKTLEAQIKCLQSNLDAANDRAMLARQEIERLKAQVPKERACVVLRPYGKYYEIAMPPIIFRDRESATIWAEERCLEVLE